MTGTIEIFIDKASDARASGSIWYAKFNDGELKGEVLPTPFFSVCPASEVMAELQKRNPHCTIIIKQ